ncbi:MAG: hypothetical protein JXR83_19625 [Deltaproteobacteria bacterium]|nr:hypothetical protein [Deltaproteobacteria bacterium]
MPKLTKAPTVRQFTDAWMERFETAVRSAAGRDGRLSLNEAKKITQRDDALRLWGDNAVNYLETTGQKSVSVDKLLGAARSYVEKAAAEVAGPDRSAGAPATISLTEARLLKPDLVDDFFELRDRRPSALASTGNASDSASANPIAFSFRCYHPGLSAALVDGWIKVKATADVPDRAKVVVRYDDHQYTLRRDGEDWDLFELRYRLADGYGGQVKNMWGSEAVFKITKDAVTAISRDAALRTARQAIEDFWKSGRLTVNSWPNREAIGWDDVVANDPKLADKLRYFGDSAAPVDIYDYGNPAYAGIESQPEHWYIHGPGPLGIETRVYVNKTTGKADKVQLEFD